MTKTATFIDSGSNGVANYEIFRVDPPMESGEWDEESRSPVEYVRVSATVVPFSGPETYIFACDEKGEVTGWGELHGSYKGGLDIDQALVGAGYEIFRPAASTDGVQS